MRKKTLRKGALCALLLLLGTAIGLLVVVGLARAEHPLTGSQVITLERAPDGWWLSQAWVLEWRSQPVQLTLIYDTWRRSEDAQAWALQYRQLDAAVTVPITAANRWSALSLTLGHRLRWDVGGRLGGAGPSAWYVMAVMGW